MFGIGNWVGVAEHVGNKSPERCKQHYFDTYIHVESFPHPTPAPELANLTEVCVGGNTLGVWVRGWGSRKGLRPPHGSYLPLITLSLLLLQAELRAGTIQAQQSSSAFGEPLRRQLEGPPQQQQVKKEQTEDDNGGVAAGGTSDGGAVAAAAADTSGGALLFKQEVTGDEMVEGGGGVSLEAEAPHGLKRPRQSGKDGQAQVRVCWGGALPSTLNIHLLTHVLSPRSLFPPARALITSACVRLPPPSPVSFPPAGQRPVRPWRCGQGSCRGRGPRGDGADSSDGGGAPHACRRRNTCCNTRNNTRCCRAVVTALDQREGAQRQGGGPSIVALLRPSLFLPPPLPYFG